MVKMLGECGEDVDQRDQVSVFSSLCHFCAKPKPDFTLSLFLGILTFFSCLSRLQVGACVGFAPAFELAGYKKQELVWNSYHIPCVCERIHP